MEKCNCYVEDTYLTYDNVLLTPNYKIVSRCNGTKERDVCSCGGNETKCDFYPAKRADAQARKVTDEFKANRKYTYEETRDQFLLALNSNAYTNMCTCYDMKNVIETLDKQIPKKVVRDGDDESDYVYCPCCHECIGVNEFVWEDFYYKDWKPMHCQECGQAMIWK